MKTIREKLILILVILVLSAVKSIAQNNSGKCGTNLTWTFTSGTLTISGTGDMTNYYDGNQPWYSFRYSIRTVTIKDGARSIGNCAFYNCSSLASVTILSSVRSIGKEAFYGCSSLSSITLPNGLTTIKEMAFRDCTGLTSIKIPYGVTTIEQKAFSFCSGLTSITVNWATPLSINSDVFRGITPADIRLLVPPGTKTLYQAAPVWQDFRIEESTTGIDDIQTSTLVRLEQSGDELYFSHPTAVIDGVEIFDVNGRSIDRRSGSVQSVSVSSWAKGMYLVVVRAGNSKSTHKFMKK